MRRWALMPAETGHKKSTAPRGVAGRHDLLKDALGVLYRYRGGVMVASAGGEGWRVITLEEASKLGGGGSYWVKVNLAEYAALEARFAPPVAKKRTPRRTRDR